MAWASETFGGLVGAVSVAKVPASRHRRTVRRTSPGSQAGVQNVRITETSESENKVTPAHTRPRAANDITPGCHRCDADVDHAFTRACATCIEVNAPK